MTFDHNHIWERGFSEIRKKTDKLNRDIYLWQCLTCGHPNSNILPYNDPDIATEAPIDPWDETLQQKWFDAFAASTVKQNKDENKIWWDKYNTYLASPEWRAKSIAVRARDPVCQGCRQNFSEQAHHVTYRNVGHEFLFELIALCAKCHDRLHDLKKAQNAKSNRK